jgi:hypothetical protein
MAGRLGESLEQRPAKDLCGIEVIERKDTLTNENVKWTGENVLPSRPLAME